MNSTKYTMTDKNTNSNRDYRTSVEAGLKRLESQKLGFLGAGRVVSKFDAQNIVAYSMPQQSEVLPPGDCTVEDLSGSDRLGTDLEMSLNPGEDCGLGELDDYAKTTSFEPEHVSILKNFDIDKLLGDEPADKPETLELAGIKGYASDASVPVSGRAATVADVLGDRETGEAERVSRKDSDSFDGLRTIQAEQLPELDALRAKYNARAQVLRPAQIRARESLRDDHEQAIDRLKNRGLFEPVGHGEVLKSLRDIQAVDALIPPSELKPYDASEDLDDMTVDQRQEARAVRGGVVPEDDPDDMTVDQRYETQHDQSPIAEDAEDQTVDQSQGAVQSLRGYALPGQEPEEDRTVDVGGAARDVVEQLESVKRLQAEDEKRFKAEEEKLRKAEAAIRKQTAEAKLRKAELEKANKPDIVPVGDLNDAEIEGRETVPLDVSQYSMDELKNAFPAKRRVAAQTIQGSDSVLVVEDEEPSLNLALILVLVFLLICGLVWLLYELDVFSGFSQKLSPYQAPQIQELVNGGDRQELEQTRADIAQVSHLFGTVFDDKAALRSWLDSKIVKAEDPNEAMPYIELALGFYPEETSYYRKLIEAYIDTKQFATARALLKGIPPEIRSQEDIRMLGYMIFAGDPAFISPALEVTEELCDEIAPLGGGSTLTFKFKKKGENVGAFKPLQNRKQSNYRAEIAAWRVCELLQCDFRVPWNRPVKVERSMFNKLYNRTTSSKREAYRKELVDLTWTKEGDRYYVYGTLKDWVPDFTRFPIEKTAMWRPWLSQEKYIENAKFAPLREALQSLQGSQYTKKLYTEILRQSPDLTTEQLASQISQVLVFDYLIGNWDRFSGVPEWAGVNCQFKDNKIVSIDNGASFPAYSNEKVYERFMMAERFSMHMIDALRALDKGQTFKLLFPEPSKYETEAFEQFWKQRSSLLTRIDSLSQTYGSKRVLSFE